ncbi:kinesin-like nuclear fusion protein [Coemansia sp. RSA 485]|nr:kinesin-like nuclear fusion protein [Coemansia sp. RSA 485]
MTTGLRVPGSMIKPPSKIGGFTSATSTNIASKPAATNGKRKAAENANERSVARPSSAAEMRHSGLGKPTRLQASRLAKPGTTETVMAGRRSSQGFIVSPKHNNATLSNGAHLASKDVLTKTTSTAGGIRALPKHSGLASGPSRMAASRTSSTRGRVNVGKLGGTMPMGNIATMESVKRRRLEVPASLRSKLEMPASGVGKKANAKASTKAAGSNANQNGYLGQQAQQDDHNNNNEGDEDDDDDDDDEDDDDDKSLGPPPAIHDRPENDINGRLKDLEAFSRYMIQKNRTARKTKKLLSVELEHNTTQVAQLEFDKNILAAKLEDAEKQAQSIQAAIDEKQKALQDEKRRHEDEVDDIKRKFKRQNELMQDEQRVLKKRVEEIQESLESTKTRLSAKKDECTRLENTISKQATDQLELESSFRSLKAKVEQLEDTISSREIQIAELQEAVSSRNNLISELEAKLRVEETTRRRLHNTIQELRGNIRVFCRVRPLLVEEKSSDAALPIKLPESEEQNEIELTQSSENALGKATAKTFPFKFDRVFAPESTQDTVFEEVSQLIQSALDGYPVCIFAYGQTGSGKTHTMQGPDAIESTDDKALGIIPRAVQQIYDTTSKLAERGWEYVLEGQFVEIYNETLQDLLAPAGRSGSSQPNAGDKQTKLEIYQDSDGHTRVKNVTTVRVDSAKRVHWLLARAAENRTVAATNCNERSSRSHSVFTLYLRGNNALTGESSSGVLNLIDLAGSERLSSSGSSGDRLKETQAINKSLSSLGDVIAALAKGSRHIPYRNSKLTHLLQESLGAGNSKTLMFVCVNPSSASAQESLCSLQFATKVNSCHIGTARRQAAS